MSPTEPSIQLLHDVATRLETDDFAHSSYVDVLAAALRSGKQPMTVGLLGPWGVGKSSILLALKERLRSDSCAFVEFDAWRYDGDTLRRQLLRDVASALDEQDALPRRFRVRRRLEELDVDQQVTSMRVRPSLGGLATALVQALVVAVGVLAALQIHAVKDALNAQSTQDGLLLTLILGLITFAGTSAGQLLRPLPMVRTRRRTEDPERFHALFRRLVCEAKSERIVIAIDNLDRCAPEVAIELLSTIKTYLEPAAEQARKSGRARSRCIGGKKTVTEVLFVLAVDDTALLRHLTLPGEHDDGDAPAREYLRKIFTATMRIVPLHREDLRGYVLSKLKDLRPALGVDEDQERQLATLLDAALRTTPRQVLQFLNNLQLCLRVIEARETGLAPAIAERISDKPLVVAKLALIQERWPRRYDHLVVAPQQLDEWHRDARDPTLSLSLESDFAAFLRISDAIRAPQLRPFLAFRQAQGEHGLEGFGLFRQSVISGDRSTVSLILDQAGRIADTYLQRLDDIFAEETSAGFFAAARSVVDIALSEPRLGPDHPMTVELVRGVIDNPHFREERDALPAEPFLQAARWLEADRFDEAVGGVIRRLTSSDPERSIEAARGLASQSENIASRHREQITQQTTTPSLSDNVAALEILGRADATWLTTVAVDAIALRLEQQLSLLSGDLGDATAAVLCLMAEAPHLSDVSPRIVAALVKTSSQMPSDPVALHRAVEVAMALVAGGRDVSEPLAGWTRAVSTLEPGAAARAARTLWALSHIDGRFLELQAIVAVLAADRSGVTFLIEQTRELEVDARRAVGQAVGAIMAHNPDLSEMDGLVKVLRSVEGRRFSTTALDAALEWAGRGVRLEQLEWLVSAAGVKTGGSSSSEELAIEVAYAQEDLASALGWLRFAAHRQPVSNPLANALIRALRDLVVGRQSPSPLIVRRALEIAGRLGDKARDASEAVCRPLIRRLREMPDDEVVPLIEVLATAERLLSAGERMELRRICLARWSQSTVDPERWEQLLTRLGEFRGDEPEAVDFLRRLVQAEKLADEPVPRARLLSLAIDVLGAARPELALRLEELDLSRDPDDQRILQLLNRPSRASLGD